MRQLAEIELSSEDRSALQAAAEVLRSRFRVAEVILFGSKARGDARADSDLDLLVLTRHPPASAERWGIYDALSDVMVDHGVAFGILVEEQATWLCRAGHRLPIRDEVERDGVVV